MTSYYVDVTGISLDLLEFLGFIVIAENDEFYLLSNKGEEQILSKNGPRNIYVSDINDAEAILQHRRRLPVPPKNNSK